MPRPVTPLPRVPPVSPRTDAAADGEPAELKHTGGEQRQMDELEGRGLCCVWSSCLFCSNVRRNARRKSKVAMAEGGGDKTRGRDLYFSVHVHGL